MRLLTLAAMLISECMTAFLNWRRNNLADEHEKIGAHFQQQQDQITTLQNENEKLSAVVSAGVNIGGMPKPEVIAELEQRGELRDSIVHNLQGVQGEP